MNAVATGRHAHWQTSQSAGSCTLLVGESERQFFVGCLEAGGSMLQMPTGCVGSMRLPYFLRIGVHAL